MGADMKEILLEVKGVKVLLVDDESDVVEMFRFALEQSGAEVRSASSLTEALNILLEFEPNVIATDICLPDGDGYSLAAEVRNQAIEKGTHIIPIVAVSGYGRDDTEIFTKSTFQAFLEKPIGIEMLISTIARCKAVSNELQGQEQN